LPPPPPGCVWLGAMARAARMRHSFPLASSPARTWRARFVRNLQAQSICTQIIRYMHVCEYILSFSLSLCFFVSISEACSLPLSLSLSGFLSLACALSLARARSLFSFALSCTHALSPSRSRSLCPHFSLTLSLFPSLSLSLLLALSPTRTAQSHLTLQNSAGSSCRRSNMLTRLASSGCGTCAPGRRAQHRLLRLALMRSLS